MRISTDGGPQMDWDKNPLDYLRAARFDASTLSLILSNLLTIVVAVAQKWDVRDIMWIYWGQSVIIGAFNVARIMDLKEFSTEGVKFGDRPVEPTRKTQRQIAVFFAFHYGLFHLFYLLFLGMQKNPFQSGYLKETALLLLVFLANHAFSYAQNREQDRNRVPNIGTIMFMPYARIIPMHLTIIFGHFLAWVAGGKLVLFLLLKTGADTIMHLVEHSEARGPVRASEKSRRD